MKVVIMAGGKGSRISSVYSDIPKPMICICNKPVLEHQINCLRKQGLTDIILIIGHLGSVVKEYFRDGAEFGVHVEYIEEGSPLGTAGALFYLKDKVKEDFLLINGDLLFDVDFGAFIRKHQSKGGCATIFTHANDHPYDSAVIILDENDAVVEWLNKEDKRADYKNRVNAGLHVLSPDIFSKFGHLRKVDLDREILRPLITDGSLFAYHSPEYVKDMGTPERYAQVDRDYKNGIVSAKNLKKPQKAVFLDRDGTINEYKGFITRKEDIELISGAAEAIEIINKAGYLTIVISNQPVIARGECSFRNLMRYTTNSKRCWEKKGHILTIFLSVHITRSRDLQERGKNIKLHATAVNRSPV